MNDSRAKILIIDDIPQNVEVLGEMLGDRYETMFATSGAEGLELAAADGPDLILLDVMMPGMDGYEVCDRLKADEKTRDIPVIFVTARTDAESEVRALAAGGADFLHKPVVREVARARVKAQLELARYRHALEAQVRERTVALGEALFAAQGAERVKEALLRNASHELRTPLNQIMGGTEMLARVAPEAGQSKWLGMIRDSSRDLLRLVNELLDVARLEGGEVKLESRAFSPRAVLDQVREALLPRAQKKGLDFRTQAEGNLPDQVVGDPTRLAQALLNYADNAIKFTESGTVKLSARLLAQDAEGVQLGFEVSDTGIGIAAEDKEKLFQAFMQLDASSTRKHGGLGIGLSNVAEIARLLGGKVGATSTPGQGSAFWLMVPFRLSLPEGTQP